MNKDDYRLGQFITVASRLKRVHLNNRSLTGPQSERINRRWDKQSIMPAEVMIVGIRNLSDGYAEWYDGEGCNYSIVKTFPALLVVKSLHSKPFYTIPDE